MQLPNMPSTLTLSSVFGVAGYVFGEAWLGLAALADGSSPWWIPLATAAMGIVGPPVVKAIMARMDRDVQRAKAAAAQVPTLKSDVARLEFSLEIARREIDLLKQNEGRDDVGGLPPKGWLES